MNLISTIGGINLYVNPLSNTGSDGLVLRAVNVDSSPFGSKNKRSGYIISPAGTLSAPAVDLFDWTQDGGTTPYLYANTGGSLFYSVGGTGAWTICGNGTVGTGHMGRSVLNNTLTVSQNGGTTRYSTDGTSFTDTPLAPAGEYLEQYQNRIYITGTSNDLFYSTTNDPTNWSTSGTSDSSSFVVPGAGRPNKLFKLADRLFINKQYRQQFRWDGYSLVDTATNVGLSSPYSYGSVEGNGFWLNEKGFFTSSGDAPQLISNPINSFVNNNTGSAITSFGSAPSTIYYYDYLTAVGNMTDDITMEQVPLAIVKYNFQKNEFLNWSFFDFPATFHTYRDQNQVPQMIFGDRSGNVYQYQGTATSDRGQPIESILEIMFDYGDPATQKDWKQLWALFNPGCQAQVSIATSDTFIKGDKKWTSIGGAKEGVLFHPFQTGHRSRFLYVKIIENSTLPPWNLYGLALSATGVPSG